MYDTVSIITLVLTLRLVRLGNFIIGLETGKTTARSVSNLYATDIYLKESKAPERVVFTIYLFWDILIYNSKIIFFRGYTDFSRFSFLFLYSPWNLFR